MDESFVLKMLQDPSVAVQKKHSPNALSTKAVSTSIPYDAPESFVSLTEIVGHLIYASNGIVCRDTLAI